MFKDDDIPTSIPVSAPEKIAIVSSVSTENPHQVQFANFGKWGDPGISIKVGPTGKTFTIVGNTTLTNFGFASEMRFPLGGKTQLAVEVAGLPLGANGGFMMKLNFDSDGILQPHNQSDIAYGYPNDTYVSLKNCKLIFDLPKAIVDRGYLGKIGFVFPQGNYGNTITIGVYPI